MDLSHTVRKILGVLTLGLGISFGQKIVHMNGTYDLDGDAQLEFIALELDPNDDVFPTTVRYYEIDADGYQTLIWEFTPPLALEGQFVDAQIGDMDGDGKDEKCDHVPCEDEEDKTGHLSDKALVAKVKKTIPKLISKLILKNKIIIGKRNNSTIIIERI